MAPLNPLKKQTSRGSLGQKKLGGSGSFKKIKADKNSSINRKKRKHASLSPAISKILRHESCTPALGRQTGGVENSHEMTKMHNTSNQTRQRQGKNNEKIHSSNTKGSNRLSRRKRRRLRKKQLAGAEADLAIERTKSKKITKNWFLKTDSGITESSEKGKTSNNDGNQDSENSDASDDVSIDNVQEEEEEEEISDGENDKSVTVEGGKVKDSDAENNLEEDGGREEDTSGDVDENIGINTDENDVDSSDSEGNSEGRVEGQIALSGDEVSSGEEMDLNSFYVKEKFTAKGVQETLEEEQDNGAEEGKYITVKQQKSKEKAVNIRQKKEGIKDTIGQKEDMQLALKKNKSKLNLKEKRSEETKFIIFITNLPFRATEDDIRKHFKDVPGIKNVNVMEDEKTGKSFGRATMELDDYISYAKALAMHRICMNDRPLFIAPDKSMPKGISKGLIQTKTEEEGHKMYRVCMSQLPLSVTLKTIKQHFSAHGQVKRFIVPAVNKKTQIKISQRAMILEFDSRDSYEKILKLNGSLVAGYPVTIEPLSQNTSGEKKRKRKVDELEAESSALKKLKVEETDQSSDQTSGKHEFAVFVGSIPLLATKKALRTHFEEAGEVLECRVREPAENSKCSVKTAFVRMADETGYQNALALRGSKLDGQQLTIEAFRKSSERKKKRFVVFVGNIPFSTKEDDMRKHFKDVGKILDVRFPLNKENKSQGYAYVEFAEQAAYEKSLTLHHSFINGRRINVCYSTSQRKYRDKKTNRSTVKQKLFKLQTLSQKHHLQRKGPVKRRSKPDKKKRRFNRLQKTQQ